MKLRNKKTGEIVDTLCSDDITKGISFGIDHHDGNPTMAYYCSLAELNEDWEDAPEEPKEYWYIEEDGDVVEMTYQEDDKFDQKRRQIGNYFSSLEEAKLAVRRLKAWKRLEDGGITFKNWTINQTGTIDCFATWGDNIPPSRKNPTLLEDLDLIFGGEK